MTNVFIIAECGSNWRFGDKTKYHMDSSATVTSDELMNAFRMIRASKECGADAAKFQWVSDYRELMKRRGEKDDEETRRVYSYVHFDPSWLPLLKAECDRVGIEFMCTAYLPQDVAVIAPFVKRFKVAAKEETYHELFEEIAKCPQKAIMSVSHDGDIAPYGNPWDNAVYARIWCVSKYPAPLEDLGLRWKWADDREHHVRMEDWDGLSDHTGHVLTGAVAVGAGARIIESHVRLHDTPRECPDWGHSTELTELVMTISESDLHKPAPALYSRYVQNIRTAERML